MRSAVLRLAARGHQSKAALQTEPRRDLRLLRDEHVQRAREKIFGPQGNMPGDRYFRKKLEGRTLMKHYFPSKFSLQDFQNEEYFEMQAERFAPRAPHRCMGLLNSTAMQAAQHREDLRSFFQGLDEETFLNTPTLQDLYGVFRMVDPDPVFSFPVPENIFLEHSPLWGASPPFRYPSQSIEPGSSSEHPEEETQRAATSSREEEMPEELLALWALVTEKLVEKEGKAVANSLDARINMMQSQEEVRTLLLEEAQQLGLVAPFENSSVIVEDGRLAAYLVRAEGGGSKASRDKSQKEAEQELAKMKTKGPEKVRKYLTRRHRFVDPMFRRRRLKWLERQEAGQNKEREVKFNSYYATHPDDHKEWPTNKGSVTVVWPSPYH